MAESITGGPASKAIRRDYIDARYIKDEEGNAQHETGQ